MEVRWSWDEGTVMVAGGARCTVEVRWSWDEGAVMAVKEHGARWKYAGAQSEFKKKEKEKKRRIMVVNATANLQDKAMFEGCTSSIRGKIDFRSRDGAMIFLGFFATLERLRLKSLFGTFDLSRG